MLLFFAFIFAIGGAPYPAAVFIALHWWMES